MCPACIATAAGMVVGAGSAGGILAVFVGHIRRLFKVSSPEPLHTTKGPLQKTKED